MPSFLVSLVLVLRVEPRAPCLPGKHTNGQATPSGAVDTGGREES